MISTPDLQFYLHDYQGWTTFYLAPGADGFLEAKDDQGIILPNAGIHPIPKLNFPILVKFDGAYYTVNCNSGNL